MHCDKDINVYQEWLERQRVYLFLGGLDDEFEQVRGEVLCKESPLELQGSNAFVRRESDRKEAMKQEGEKAEAMVVRNKSSHNRSGPSGSTSRPSTVNSFSHQPNAGSTHARPKIDRFKLVCSHYGLGGHSKARCFELIGYPEGWDKTRDPRYNKQRATIADTKDELDLVANQASALVTTIGNEGKVFANF
ncbi:hypothetical protein MRB53_033287 [Persea americana]|uniref:Uncharacterized protein n=1 Tax=Persea americana TaxID=3435 RepID=A0ACC2KUI8_PERAE|nr:hypothetical protein MRB53_033287 [Persea americana]